MNIKSISLASWTQEEIVKLQHGGNLRLKSLLIQYGIPKDIALQHKYKSKALEYYRDLLKSEIYNVPSPVPPRLDEGYDYNLANQKSWWTRSKDSFQSWITFRNVKFAKVSLQNETIEKIKNTGVNAICGLREYTCSTARGTFSNYSENPEPNYVKMEEIPNKDNSR